MNVKEIWSKYKKNIIACIVVVFLCAVSFTCGRCIRVERAQSAGTAVEQSISGAGVSADKISNDINFEGNLLGNISGRTDTAISGVDAASGDAEELRSLINECKSTFEASQREFENRIGGISKSLDTADYILQVAQLKAEQDATTLSRLAELLGYSDGGTEKQ